MARKAIVLGVAVFIAGVCTTTSIAKEPASGVWGTWCGWLDSIGLRRANREPERNGMGSSSWPEMPVDHSYDHLVDQP